MRNILSNFIRLVKKKRTDIILIIIVFLLMLLCFALGYLTAKYFNIREPIQFIEKPL